MKTMLLEDSQTSLMKLWMSGSAVIFLLFVAQSILRVDYSQNRQELWGWLLPTIVPILSLILTVMKMHALDETTSGLRVRIVYHKLAFSLSAIYLTLVLGTIIAEAVARPSDSLEYFASSNLWLGPLQGLCASAVGAVFFTNQQQSAREAKSDAQLDSADGHS